MERTWFAKFLLLTYQCRNQNETLTSTHFMLGNLCPIIAVRPVQKT